MDKKITIFKNLFKTDVSFTITLAESAKRIKEGKSKNLIEAIRKEEDKEKRNDLKKKLPAIIFAGVFEQRNKNGLKEHSGLMITDFDGIPTNEVGIEFEKIKKNKHVALLFRSPSGNGFKAVVRIPPCTILEHEKYFKAFEEEFQYTYFDKSNSDVSRVCFESYDPNLYYNPKATVYSPKLEDKGFYVHQRISYTPIESESEIIERIMKWNWGTSFSEGERNTHIFNIAGAFCEFGIRESTAEAYILSEVVQGRFTDKEAKNTIRNAYRQREFKSRFFEDYKQRKQLHKDVRIKSKEQIKETYKLNDRDYEEVRDEAMQADFWETEIDKNSKAKIKINPLHFKIFLENNGYKKTYINESQSPTFVKIIENKVTETSPEKIKDFVLNYLMKNKEIDVWNYCANYSNLFSEQFLTMLDSIELAMLEDTSKYSHIAYNNGILKVSKDEINLHDYIDIDGYVWENQIIKRDFKRANSDNDYKEFVKNISNGDPKPFEHTIGYLISTYKNKTNNKAVILNDEIISDNPEGGSGKGLFVQGISQVRNVSILDGKQFDDRKSFPYQTVSSETHILVFDDVKKNWDFESKFSLVTEGITLERKNKDALKLSVENSPKIVISTNYAIKGGGHSHERRRHELEISKYYGAKKTPFDDFGRQLFDDWTKDEFTAFDNYMVECLQLYLKHGLIEQEAKNKLLKGLIVNTNHDFVEWAKDTIETNFDYSKSTLYFDFTTAYPDFAKMKQKTLTIWLKEYAKYKSWSVEERRSGNDRYIKFYDFGDLSYKGRGDVEEEEKGEEKLPFMPD